MVKEDGLWPGGPRFYFDDALFLPSTDSFLLGAFPRLHRGERVCDLGSGTGLLGLLLAARCEGLSLTNVELDPRAAALSRESYARNGLAAQHLTADLRDPGQLPGRECFDLVISNPPYFAPERGAVAEGARGVARSSGCTVEELCRAAGRLLRYGGRFALIFRTERMAELFCGLRAEKLEPKRLRMIQNTAASAPSLFLLECKKGGGSGLIAEPPLLLRDERGEETADVRRAYFREKEA